MLNILKRLVVFVLPVTVVVAGIGLKWGSDLAQKEQLKNHTYLLQQTSSAAQYLQLVSQQLKANMLAVAKNEESFHRVNNSYSLRPQSKSFAESDFQFIGYLEIGAQAQWGLQWASVKPGLSQVTLTKWNNIFNQDLDINQLQEGSVYFRPIVNLSGNSYLASMTIKSESIDSSGVLISLLPLEYFVGFMQSHKNNADESLLLADDAYALSLTKVKYLGGKMDDHSVVQQLSNLNGTTGSFSLKGLKGETNIVSFERLKDTNLTVVMQSQAGLGLGISPQDWMFLLLLIIAAISLNLILANILKTKDVTRSNSKSYKKSISLLANEEELPEAILQDLPDKYAQALKAIERKLQQAELSHKPIEREPVPEQSETKGARQDLIHNMSKGLAGSLNFPLAKLIKAYQGAKTSPDEQSLSSELNAIGEAIKQIRSIKDHLDTLTEDDKSVTAPVQLAEVALDLLQEKSNLFQKRGIHIHKSIDEKVFAKASQVQIEKAVDLSLMFLANSFSDGVERNLLINLSQLEGDAVLSFESNSFKVNQELIGKMTEPFQISQLDGIEGIYLAVVDKLMRQQGGSLRVFEREGAGFILQLSLSLSTEAEYRHYLNQALELPENNLEEPTRDEVASIVEPVVKDDGYEIVLGVNHDEVDVKNQNAPIEDSFSGFTTAHSTSVTEIELEKDDFVMKKMSQKPDKTEIKTEDKQSNDVQIRRPKVNSK